MIIYENCSFDWLYKTSVLSNFTSIQDLENNLWVYLDLLGDIYDIYANLTMMTFLNLNHF